MGLMKRYQALKDKVIDRKEEFQALMSYVENAGSWSCFVLEQ